MEVNEKTGSQVVSADKFQGIPLIIDRCNIKTYGFLLANNLLNWDLDGLLKRPLLQEKRYVS